tara:strand:+ start:83 stop:649 length:567 start_codon:yes stop_codon:yes gene_type:complete
MKDNFFITCHGRSGSQFLATLMNNSPLWTVTHEASGHDRSIENIQKRFERDWYGDVSGQHRYHFDKLRVKKRGIILREPRDIFLSCCNRGYSYYRLMETIPKIHWSWGILNKRLEMDSSICKILFSKITTDLDYVQDVCLFFGIKDIDFSSIDLSNKINTNRKEHHCYDNFDMLPLDVQKRWTTYDWQ